MPTKSDEKYLSINSTKVESDIIYSNLFLVRLLFENSFLSVLINPLLFKREKRSNPSVMMRIVKIFKLSVKAFLIKTPVIFKNPKNGLNLDINIDPKNSPPIVGKITSSCQMRKKILSINGSKNANPKFSNELLQIGQNNLCDLIMVFTYKRWLM